MFILYKPVLLTSHGHGLDSRTKSELKTYLTIVVRSWELMTQDLKIRIWFGALNK